VENLDVNLEERSAAGAEHVYVMNAMLYMEAIRLIKHAIVNNYLTNTAR
jgi:hypothetical protein